MRHLDEDPSIASESLDYPEGWPANEEVRQWLVRAIGFLGRIAPDGHFTFRAGWHDTPPRTAPPTDLDTLLGRIARGELRADELYEVRATEA